MTFVTRLFWICLHSKCLVGSPKSTSLRSQKYSQAPLDACYPRCCGSVRCWLVRCVIGGLASKYEGVWVLVGVWRCIWATLVFFSTDVRHVNFNWAASRLWDFGFCGVLVVALCWARIVIQVAQCKKKPPEAHRAVSLMGDEVPLGIRMRSLR